MISAFNNHFTENLEILKACTKIPGIGKAMAVQALDRAGITKNIAIGKLTASQLSQIKSIFEQNYDINNDLRTQTFLYISRLSTISAYRGLRHAQGLPCRGQRTHTNAKTRHRLKRQK